LTHWRQAEEKAARFTCVAVVYQRGRTFYCGGLVLWIPCSALPGLSVTISFHTRSFSFIWFVLFPVRVRCLDRVLVSAPSAVPLRCTALPSAATKPAAIRNGALGCRCWWLFERPPCCFVWQTTVLCRMLPATRPSPGFVLHRNYFPLLLFARFCLPWRHSTPAVHSTLVLFCRLLCCFSGLLLKRWRQSETS